MLTTSLQAQPGVYAMISGSDVSTGAGVSTGRGAVSELVRLIAAVEDSASVQNPVS